jgi:hypothetical protein
MEKGTIVLRYPPKKLPKWGRGEEKWPKWLFLGVSKHYGSQKKMKMTKSPI